jgi:hypothetical protein
LVPHLSKHLTQQGIEHEFYVGHQVDDKLFNRGAMKNIAAEYAFNDGCDYIAWHDVDMLPHEECDYSYPENNPIPNKVLGILLRLLSEPLKISPRVNFVRGIKLGPGP